ncbi:Light-independent protochlorophyllide reductase subunit B, partial [Bienertia sinuspersici]
MDASMGVNMELEFDKYCKVGRSPRTVLPSLEHQKKGDHRSRKGRQSSKTKDYDSISLEGGFTEIKFRNYRSISCKNPPSGNVELECNEALRRGSVYQSSTDRKFRRPEGQGGRKKVEYSVGTETPFSFSILDSICGSDEDAEAETEQKRPSIKSLKSETVSSTKPPRQPRVMDLKERQSDSGSCAERDSMENLKFNCQQVSSPSNNGNVLKERDSLALNKSLSAKLAMPHSPTHSEGDKPKGSPKTRFKKMFDPFTKSKTHRTPSYDSKSSSLTGVDKSKTLRKSLLHDFSSAMPEVETGVQPQPQVVSPPCSAAHLRGNLKMEQKHGVPYFEFSMAHSDDLYVAKTWKADNALNWVYTFHSIQGRKRNNSNGRGMKYSNKDSPMVGQMQVTCYLCSELRGSGAFSNSMMTEFVMYDIAHARKSEETINSPENHKMLLIVAIPIAQHLTRGPWPDLRPSFEIAAVVVEAPFEKRESLKYRRGDKLSDQVAKDMHDDNNPIKVNVVTPLGNHGLPTTTECRGPSPLLDRWRLGGGCECGGWDMACPLLVFGNRSNPCFDEHSLLEKNRPLKLFVQGGKEDMPALTITITEKGKYAVDFHAQLSILQAFAICVAIMHTTEASSLVEQEKARITEEEKKKSAKTTEEHQPSFVLDPPFSPIA